MGVFMSSPRSFLFSFYSFGTQSKIYALIPFFMKMEQKSQKRFLNLTFFVEFSGVVCRLIFVSPWRFSCIRRSGCVCVECDAGLIGETLVNAFIVFYSGRKSG